MQYYKLISENTIIGAITSNNFIYYSPVALCYIRCQEDKGEYISYKGRLYRATWMNPIVIQEDYTHVKVESIDYDEYAIIKAAIENNEVIEENEDEEEIEEPEIIDEIEEDMTLEFIRESKINEMSYNCRKTIEAGFDLEIHSEMHHFSLTTQDQLNLMSLSVLAQTLSLIPYHADGEDCTFFTAEEINMIMKTATELKVYHTTYFNALKAYINSLDTIEEISAIQYGVEIPEEYKTDVLKILEA